MQVSGVAHVFRALNTGVVLPYELLTSGIAGRHLKQGQFIDIRQNGIKPTAGLLQSEAAGGVAHPIIRPTAGGKLPVGVLVLEHAQGELFQVVRALHFPRRFAGRLHRRQEQGNQDADDRDDDQQFHQGKTTLQPPLCTHSCVSLEKSASGPQPSQNDVPSPDTGPTSATSLIRTQQDISQYAQRANERPRGSQESNIEERQFRITSAEKMSIPAARGGPQEGVERRRSRPNVNEAGIPGQSR